MSITVYSDTYGWWTNLSNTMVQFSFWVRFSTKCSPRGAGDKHFPEQYFDLIDCVMVVPISTCKFDATKKTQVVVKHVPDLF